MRHVLCLAGIIACAGTAGAEAQTDFTGLNVKSGDVLYVTTPDGMRVSGRLERLSSTTLSIEGRDFMPEAGLKIEKRGDPLWTGVMNGALAGLVVGIILSNGECGSQSSGAACTLAFTAWGGGLGLLVDWAHQGRTLVFTGTSSASPPVARLERRSAHVGFRVRF